MKIDIDKSGESLKVSIGGDLDISNSKKFAKEVIEAYKQNKKNITFNLENLEYIDSTGLGSFIQVYKTLEDGGNIIEVVGAKPNVKKIFIITEMDKLFQVEG